MEGTLRILTISPAYSSVSVYCILHTTNQQTLVDCGSVITIKLTTEEAQSQSSSAIRASGARKPRELHEHVRNDEVVGVKE
jgi:hypothetical protein